MAHLQNRVSLAVSQLLNPDSLEYQGLAGLRQASGQPLFEEIAEEDIGANPRLIAILDPGAAAASNETVSQPGEPGRPGNITSAFFFASSPGIVGAATNSRTLTVVQGSAQGAGSPARTTLATLALVAGVNAPAGQASTGFTINQAAFIGGAPLELVSTSVGTGLADPGGLVVVSYTPV